MIKSAKGFSLAELIIATAVLALLSVMLVQSFLSIFILNKTNRNSELAGQRGESQEYRFSLCIIFNCISVFLR